MIFLSMKNILNDFRPQVQPKIIERQTERTHIEVVTLPQHISNSPNKHKLSHKDVNMQSLRFKDSLDEGFQRKDYSLKRSFTIKSVDKISKASGLEERSEALGMFSILKKKFQVRPSNATGLLPNASSPIPVCLMQVCLIKFANYELM